MYKGVCSSLKEYIGEKKQNSVNRWAQHDKPSKKSNPAIHLNENIEHQFEWAVVAMASENALKRKIQDALFIAKYKQPLNDQLIHHNLTLFRNGLT